MPELAPRAVTLSMAVGASALFFTGEARAGHEFGEIALPILTLSTVGLGGAVVGISNANYVTKGERPGTGWLVSGFVFGGLNAVAGGFFTVLMIDNRPRSAVIVVGTLAHVALATADITLSITGMSKTRGGRARLPVVPIVIPDAQGKLAFGVGLELGALWAGVPLMGWPAGLGTSQTSVADDRVRLFLVNDPRPEG